VSAKDSVKTTLLVALTLCVVCSVLVSAAAVALKSRQDANRVLDRNKNILAAAGLYDPEIHSDDDIASLFAEFTPRVVDLDEARYLMDAELTALGISIASYDPRRAATDPAYSRALSKAEDIADIKRRVRYTMIYVVEDSNGMTEKIVLPISGYGLWGIMYGFLALDSDANTISGIGFYDMKETPGLGGEITNPRWNALWPGKKIYDAQGEVAFEIVRGRGNGDFEVDALAGATLTSRGVQNLITYWLGDDGFGPFLKTLGPKTLGNG
jgi:Na+-transporting NADH:ubiquinone oxidoreductase subunit C